MRVAVIGGTREIGDATVTEKVFGSPRVDFDRWLAGMHARPSERSSLG
jgi:hypothetical protein